MGPLKSANELKTRQLLDHAFDPKAIAVVGASATRGKWSNEVFRHFARHYEGTLLPVNPTRDEVEGVQACSSVMDIPHNVDYAVIVLPRDKVLAAVRDCVSTKIPIVHVLSAGFAETGGNGVYLQRALVEAVQGTSTRLIGPNSMGIYSAQSRLTFARDSHFAPGTIAFVSQSGGLCYDVLLKGQARGLNFSKILSVGNSSDLDWADYIRYFAKDPDTSVIGVYLESVGKGEEFFRELQATTPAKPVIILKGGKTAAGCTSAASHTGRLAGDYDIWQAMFRQAGAIEVDTLDDMLVAMEASVAALAMRASGAKTVDTMVMGTGGGATVLVADACALNGIAMAGLGPDAVDKLAELVPGAEDFGGIGNPLELGADRLLANPGMLANLVSATCADRNVGTLVAHLNMAAIANNLSGGTSAWEEVCKRLAQACNPAKLVCLVLRNGDAGALPQELSRVARQILVGTSGLVIHTRLEEALRLVRQIQHAVTPGDCDPATVRDPRQGGSHDTSPETRTLEGREVRSLVASYGIPFAAWTVVENEEEAVRAAGECGYPVALKSAASDILHKSDVGCVKIGLETEAAVRAGFAEVAESATRVGSSKPNLMLVEPMVTGLAEIVIGLKQSDTFGPVVLVGMGGIWVEIQSDHVLRICPVDEDDALRMLKELKGWPLLDGARGRPRADVKALGRMIAGISRLGLEHPEIIELELNPVIVGECGSDTFSVDARATASVKTAAASAP